MEYKDIKNPSLKQLFVQTKHASSTIENDAGDSLNISKSDEDFITDWQSALQNLENEVQYYWRELEKMKVCTKDSVLDQLKQARDDLGEILEVEYLTPETAHVETIRQVRIAIINAIDFCQGEEHGKVDE